MKQYSMIFFKKTFLQPMYDCSSSCPKHFRFADNAKRQRQGHAVIEGIEEPRLNLLTMDLLVERCDL